MKRLSQTREVSAQFGGKINGLIELRQLDLCVPDGLIFDQKILSDWWQPFLLAHHAREEWATLTPQDVLTALEGVEFPESWKVICQEWLSLNQSYIVRSSAVEEDGVEHSFAGQYESIGGCRTLDDLIQAIKQCISFLFHERVQAYWQRSQLLADPYQLAILIQEEVPAELAGVCFTTAPDSIEDHVMLVEVVEGHGAALVDGSSRPEAIRLDWFSPQYVVGKLSISQQEQVHAAACLVMLHFQKPMDIEFAFVDQQLYLLQARPITELSARVAHGSWTNTNFRDGGVSSQSCPPLMRWLYQRVWQESLSRFMVEAGLFGQEEIEELSCVRYARLYWNVDQVKRAMCQIPGYVEADFDDELGVDKFYEGAGHQTPWTLLSVYRLLTIASKVNRIKKSHQATIQIVYDQAQEQLNAICQQLPSLSSTDQLRALWEEVVYQHHMHLEGTYFWQVFINTVFLSMKKTALLKIVTLEDFFVLIEELGDLSHVLPLKRIAEIVESDKPDQLLEGFRSEFGYHSSRELDLLTPSYEEDLTPIKEQVAFLRAHPQAFERFRTSLEGRVDHKERVAAIYQGLSSRQAKKVERTVAELRELLWWRERLKDISTKTYHVVRQVSLRLGERYVSEGYIDQAEGIFFLLPEQVLAPTDFRREVANARLYTSAYTACSAPNDLRAEQRICQSTSNQVLRGRGANHGLVTAPVRVLNDVSEVGQIQAGEILVARFTDTGWSYAFGHLAGLITEYGGVLCHASIVARECGIPAIVCAVDATKKLQTGMLVTMNGTTGDIMIEEENKE